MSEQSRALVYCSGHAFNILEAVKE
jgi:hypothetical protein